jgi:1-acyl-sn-glycerol-3-phosphate acyltransferase
MTAIGKLANGLLDQLLDAKDRRIVTPEIDELVDRIPKPIGSFGYDPWGYNKDIFKVSLGVAERLYDHYFRVTAHGLENVPERGRLLLVPNHSGQLPLDGMMIGIALATSPHGPRLARAMIERFFPTVPWIGNFFNAVGGVIGDPINCSRMLEMEEAIIVFPEGVRGSGKLYKQRYQLQRFGNGFMHLAMNHHTPIVPVAVIGCEETMPAIANIRPLARMLGVPYMPLLALYWPLPARVSLYFGKPMTFDNRPCTEAEITERADQVKAEVQKLIAEGLARRTSIF